MPDRPLRIGVIGAGSLGGAVGRNWVRAGHEICFSSRHRETLAAMAAGLGSRATVGSVRDAARFGTVGLPPKGLAGGGGRSGSTTAQSSSGTSGFAMPLF